MTKIVKNINENKAFEKSLDVIIDRHETVCEGIIYSCRLIGKRYQCFCVKCKAILHSWSKTQTKPKNPDFDDDDD